MRTVLFPLLFLIFIPVIKIKAQERCATVIYNQQLNNASSHPERLQVFEKWMKEKRTARASEPSLLGLKEETVYVIPVVVHIIHNGEVVGEGVNIPESQVLSQIEVLNEDYRRLNFDTVNTPEMFKPVAADTRIEFRLATRDPDGAPTNGIVRKTGTQSTWSSTSSTDDRELKSLSFWAPEDYFNIWVTDLAGSYIGYAQYPQTDLPGSIPPFDRETDGIVIDYTAFGSTAKGDYPNLRSQYNRGRTTTHEVGHFLGLRHIWGDGGCTATDYCEDTPVQLDSYASCDHIEAFSCGSDDMYQNYMDYSHDECMNIFTINQKERMRIVLENSPRRASLLTSPALSLPSSQPNMLVVREIIAPSTISCEALFTPEIHIQNTGYNTVSEFDVFLSLDEQEYPLQRYELTLDPGESQSLPLTDITGGTEVVKGQHFMRVGIRNPNGIDTVNHEFLDKSKYFLSNPAGNFAPFREGFEVNNFLDSEWDIYNPDNDISWEMVNINYYDHTNPTVSINMFDYSAIGQEDWLVSPVIDLSETAETFMTFNYSYAQYDTITDLLEIKVSVDCGESFPFSIYSAESDELSAVNISVPWEPQATNDWQRKIIDLSQFAGHENVRLAFITYNGGGNNLYLDDIEFHVTGYNLTEDIDPGINSFIVYPNPTGRGNFFIRFNTQERQPIQIMIINTAGKIIMQKNFDTILNQTIEFDLAGYQNGIYLIKASGNSFNKTARVFLNK